MVKKSFQSICKRALLLINRIHMWRNRNNRDMGIYMYWHFPQHPVSLSNDVYAASDMLQFILASSIHCLSTKYMCKQKISWTNQIIKRSKKQKLLYIEFLKLIIWISIVFNLIAYRTPKQTGSVIPKGKQTTLHLSSLFKQMKAFLDSGSK